MLVEPRSLGVSSYGYLPQPAVPAAHYYALA